MHSTKAKLESMHSTSSMQPDAAHFGTRGKADAAQSLEESPDKSRAGHELQGRGGGCYELQGD